MSKLRELVDVVCLHCKKVWQWNDTGKEVPAICPRCQDKGITDEDIIYHTDEQFFDDYSDADNGL
jgi:hypothetical protein